MPLPELTAPIDLGAVASFKPLEKPKMCSTCGFSEKEGTDLVCRFDPPKVFAFMVPVMQAPRVMAGQQIPNFQVTTQTCFPVVLPGQWCGKFAPKT
jgi:hypothetical protein